MPCTEFAVVAEVLLWSVSAGEWKNKRIHFFFPLLAGDDWNSTECAGNEKTDHPYG